MPAINNSNANDGWKHGSTFSLSQLTEKQGEGKFHLLATDMLHMMTDKLKCCICLFAQQDAWRDVKLELW